MEHPNKGALADPLHAGVAVLVQAPQRSAEAMIDAYANGDTGPIETLRGLTTLLRSVEAVLKPLQEAREAIRALMERPLLAAGGSVELPNEASVAWVEPIITESYERAKVDQFVADLAAQGGPMTDVAAQLAALKKVGTRAGFVKVDKPRTAQAPSDEPPF